MPSWPNGLPIFCLPCPTLNRRAAMSVLAGGCGGRPRAARYTGPMRLTDAEQTGSGRACRRLDAGRNRYVIRGTAASSVRVYGSCG